MAWFVPGEVHGGPYLALASYGDPSQSHARPGFSHMLRIASFDQSVTQRTPVLAPAVPLDV